MVENLIRRAIRALADILSSKYHENFDMTSSAEELYESGITLKASGFVFPSGDSAVGVYIVKYTPSIKENKYGRYN